MTLSSVEHSTGSRWMAPAPETMTLHTCSVVGREYWHRFPSRRVSSPA
jgi:hypothetical protein